MMVVGSTIDDVMTVQPPSPGELKKLQSEAAAGIHEKTTCTAEPSCEKLASFHACMGTRLVRSGFCHYSTIPEVWLQSFHRSQIWFVWLRWAALWAISELALPVALTRVQLPWYLVSQEGSIGCLYTPHTTNPCLSPLTHTHSHISTSQGGTQWTEGAQEIDREGQTRGCTSGNQTQKGGQLRTLYWDQ